MWVWIVVLVIIAGLLLWWISNRWLCVSRRDLSLDWLPPAWDNVRILHLSDLHSSRYGKHNEKLAARIRELHPDFILAPGDLCDRFAKRGDAFLDLLEQLKGEFPIYVSIGNHELRVEQNAPENYRIFRESLSQKGVTVLDNTSVVLERQGQCLRLYGINQPLSIYYQHGTLQRVEDYLGERDPAYPALLLAHDPRWLERYAHWGASLVLAGHIHGGMLRLPLIGGVYSPDKTFFPQYDAGVFTKDGCTMVVSRGAGDSRPFRIGSLPEMVLLTLHTKRGDVDV
nr:metallophosphoesterase [uncultured Solibaculum sp.]